jgi:hypothetical protein
MGRIDGIPFPQGGAVEVEQPVQARGLAAPGLELPHPLDQSGLDQAGYGRISPGPALAEIASGGLLTDEAGSSLVGVEQQDHQDRELGRSYGRVPKPPNRRRRAVTNPSGIHFHEFLLSFSGNDRQSSAMKRNSKFRLLW